METLKLLQENDGITYFLYKPSFFSLYYNCYTEDEIPHYFSRIVHKVRMVIEMLKSQYQVVYMKKDEKIVGHLVVGRGGSRITMSTKKDIVIGPIWVIPKERANGYGSKGIHFILNEMPIDYEYAYEYIEKDNLPSIRTVEKNGFSLVGECNEYGVLKKIRPCKDGHLYVYRKENLKGKIRE